MSAPVQSNGLPVRIVAVAAPSKSKSRRLSSVHIVTEVSGAGLADADGLEVKALGVDMTGRVRATDRFVGRLESPLRTDDARWLRVGLTLDLPPGRYQLRVAAARADQRAGGSVFEEIDVPDFRKELAAGGLVLGTPTRAGGADGIATYLGCVPMATRDLRAEMTVRAGLPLQVSARHRLARLRFVGRLVGPGAETRELLRVERPAAAFTDGGTFDFDLPFQGLTPGDYQLRLEIMLGDLSAHREMSFHLSSGS